MRALEPLAGLDAMRARRGVEDERLLCSGPGRLCQALGVTREHDGLPLDRAAVRAAAGAPSRAEVVDRRRGSGITKAVEQPWRYGLAGSRVRQPAVLAGSAGRGARAAPTVKSCTVVGSLQWPLSSSSLRSRQHDVLASTCRGTAAA